MPKTPPIRSTADALDALGRDAVRERLKLTPSSMSDALRGDDAKFPARWYAPMKELADERGVELPLDVFHWRKTDAA